ncbi:hypothetical protein ZIOFF_045343 [Zingiber officinale]|uniref:Uncharacterized protein n=1 Tax=Zingiber officinale TaxID=94328 RepID=A0A8J5G6R4_ZINOF|nr:hypothetical protein ZIOFF_045343 [Zingiber officinale]
MSFEIELVPRQPPEQGRRRRCCHRRGGRGNRRGRTPRCRACGRRRRPVEAAGGLVEEEQRRLGEELDADADAPPLMPLTCHPPILVSMAAANPISLIVASALARFAGVDMESGSWSCAE